MVGKPASPQAAPPGDRRLLLVGEPAEEAEGGEHLGVLLVEGSRLAHRLLAAVGEMEVDAHADPLAERRLGAGPGECVAVADHRPLAEKGGAAADDALDAVPDHEVEAPGVRAHDRLPAFDGEARGARHQGEVLELVAAVGQLRRELVVLAAVREALVVESLEDDFDLLLEELPVLVLVHHEPAQGLDLAGCGSRAPPRRSPARR